MTTPNTQPTCPKCGCQTISPFGDGKVIHDTEACQGIKSTTQPTTDEVAREIAGQIIKSLNGRRDLHISNCSKEVQKGIRNEFISISHAALTTHTAKLRAENEGLKSQNAVMVDLLNDSARTLEYVNPQAAERIKAKLSALPTTPNLVDQVRELEKENLELKERIESVCKSIALGDGE